VGRPEQQTGPDARRDAETGGAGRDWEPDEVWIEERQADTPRTTSGGPARVDGQRADAVHHRRNVPPNVVAELTRVDPVRGPRLASRLADATHAYDRERYEEARKILRPIAEEVPDVVAVKELYGLTLYRSGDWAGAVRQLEGYRTLTGSYDQHPVLADCYRALHRYPEAEALWDDLRQASPDGDLVAEGRIVAAGCRADQGDLRGAIVVLERAAKRVDHPQERHLRQWYALADLYERAGDVPRARELFGRVAAADPDAFDVRQRLRALR